MLAFVIVTSLILTIMVNVASSCFVCYNVAVDPDSPVATLTTVSGIVLLNALFPFFLGCLTGLWYIG